MHPGTGERRQTQKAVDVADLVFILGTGRCGSTLAYEALCTHPGVGFVSNLDDRQGRRNPSGRWNNRLYRLTPPKLGLRRRVAPSEGYRLLERQVSPILSRATRDLTADDVTPWLQQRLERFFNERLLAQHQPLFAHKFTGWPRAEFLHRVFPEARFVHVVRDGRAVANSFLQMRWWDGFEGPGNWRYGTLPAHYEEEWRDSGGSHVLLAGIAWKMLIDRFELSRTRIPGALWLQIRYEDLVSSPRAQLGAVLEFLGQSWNEQFEASFRQLTFHTSREAAYRRDLSAGQLALLTRSLADHLDRLGYER